MVPRCEVEVDDFWLGKCGVADLLLANIGDSLRPTAFRGIFFARFEAGVVDFLLVGWELRVAAFCEQELLESESMEIGQYRSDHLPKSTTLDVVGHNK
jgi:hypothetical protein